MGRVRHVSWLCESAQSINRSKICTQCCPNAAACCCFMGLPLPKCFPFLWLYFFATGSLTGTWQDLWPRVEWNVLTFRSNCRNWETNDRQSDWQIDWRQRLVVLSNICICRLNTPRAHCAHSVLDPCVFVCLFTFNPLTPLDECPEQGLAWPDLAWRWAYTNNTLGAEARSKQTREEFNGLQQSLTRPRCLQIPLGSSSVLNCCSTKCIEACRTAWLSSGGKGFAGRGERATQSISPKLATHLIEFVLKTICC